MNPSAEFAQTSWTDQNPARRGWRSYQLAPMGAAGLRVMTWAMMLAGEPARQILEGLLDISVPSLQRAARLRLSDSVAEEIAHRKI